MLSLARRPGESILIFPAKDLDPDMTVAELFANGAIEIRLNTIGRGQVSLGIDAPRALAVARNELLKADSGST